MAGRKFVIFVGLTGTGKTTLIADIVKNYKRGKVLIDDQQNDPLYKEYPLIPIAAIPFQTSGKYRFYDPDWKATYTMLNDEFNTHKQRFDGLLNMEDCSRWIRDNEFTPLASLSRSRRHLHLDIIATFHSLNDVPPYIYANVDEIVLFKTNDNPVKHLKDSIPQPELVVQAFKDVENDPSPYAFQIVRIRAAS